MELIFGVLPLVATVGGLTAWWIYRRRTRRPWCELLRGLGQTYPHLREVVDPRRGRAPDRVDLPRGEALVRLERRRGTESTDMVVSLEARWPVPAGPEFRVINEGMMESVFKEWGILPDVTVGQREFDAQFVVNARDEGAMRAAWSPRAREIMLKRSPRYVRSDGRMITTEAMASSPEEVGELAELVAELATADLFGIGALRAMPGTTYHAPSGDFDARTPPQVEVEARGTQEKVRLEPASVTELVARPVTQASITASVETGEWSVGVRASGELEGEREGLPLPQGLHGRLYGVGAGTLVQRGRAVSFTWSAVETDPERLHAAVELLALFARPVPKGAYR